MPDFNFEGERFTLFCGFVCLSVWFLFHRKNKSILSQFQGNSCEEGYNGKVEEQFFAEKTEDIFFLLIDLNIQEIPSMYKI